jgi:hypothetical protein
LLRQQLQERVFDVAATLPPPSRAAFVEGVFAEWPAAPKESPKVLGPLGGTPGFRVALVPAVPLREAALVPAVMMPVAAMWELRLLVLWPVSSWSEMPTEHDVLLMKYDRYIVNDIS